MRGTLMANWLVCPMCKTNAVKPLDKTSDTQGYDCPNCGRFRVASSVFAEVARTRRREARRVHQTAAVRPLPIAFSSSTTMPPRASSLRITSRPRDFL